MSSLLPSSLLSDSEFEQALAEDDGDDDDSGDGNGGGDGGGGGGNGGDGGGTGGRGAKSANTRDNPGALSFQKLFCKVYIRMMNT